MLKKVYSILLTISLMLPFTVRADEGMWLPLLIKRLNYVDMQKQGLQLTAEEIYSVNNSSLKDAIVQFGGFCTGEFISSEGLLLTNHHCGYDAIAANSTPENNYLKDGFWAMTREQERKNEGLFVDILVRMEDVTGQVLQGITPQTAEEERGKLVGERMRSLADAAKNNGQYVTYVRDFFNGNEFYLFVYERFNDVRLVGAPPESIGKFGGDTDNWMWPRHTGDFSLFRVYMGPDGKPAPYSPQNLPYKPKHHLPISMSNVQEGDFSMVFGFPGRTTRFMTGSGLAMAVEQSNPARIKLRERRLAIMKEAMDASPANRLKLASEYASISNYYKYFIGQNEGIKRMKTLDKKATEEQVFQTWASADPNRKNLYGSALSDINASYANQRKYNLASIYRTEAALAPQLMSHAYQYTPLYNLLKEGNVDQTRLKQLVEAYKGMNNEFYENYLATTDQRMFAELMQMFFNDVPKEQHGEIFKDLRSKYNNNFQKWAADVYSKSFLSSAAKANAFLANPTQKAMENDPAFKVLLAVQQNHQQNILPKLNEAQAALNRANRLYVAGLREMNPDKVYYPDANSTLRLSFGTVQGYEPRDGVKYKYYTTMEGIAEKADPEDEEFLVPDKLLKLYEQKDYGRYGQNGELRVAFITNNDITGGNSGSPVINGRGELMGLAFDGNWEAMTGDLVFDPEYKRCINVDIKYVLFIIDKFAGAGHLVQEMTLVSNGNPNVTFNPAINDIKMDGKIEVETEDAQIKIKKKGNETKIKKEVKGKKKFRLWPFS
ncbi:S46 family peptidase [Rufibacter roseus]|uniref:Dipeptidyl-peptidase n=1 Tax=Rufibacter roseus TaxID=1567108 RepID=A0ABW2DPU1_9BACT|nr:S46 family peptidase [Rufibacter roseus]